MITQFGINMLVPIFLCTAAGIYIGRKFSIQWITIPLFLIGALAGFRNIFIMAKGIYSDGTKASPYHSEKKTAPKNKDTYLENTVKDKETRENGKG